MFIIDDLDKIHSGPLYSLVITKGAGSISKLYPDITTEINERKFATRTRSSYAHIPEYYTLPLNTPYIDRGPGPYHPYARYSKNAHPKWATSDQTPELLLEPFGDPEVRSWSTMAEMVDMHTKKLSFTIIKDDDVIIIYQKLTAFIDSMRGIRFTREAKDYVDYLNKIMDFLDELRQLYLSICKKRHIQYVDNAFIQFIQKQAVAL